MTTVSVNPSRVSKSVGSTFTVTFDVDLVQNLGAYQLSVRWNPKILQCLSVVNKLTDFNLYVPVQIDNTIGAFAIAATSLSTLPSSLSGALCSATFTIIADGSTPIHIQLAWTPDWRWDSFLLDIDVNEIPTLWVDGVAIPPGVLTATVTGTVTDSVTGAPLQEVSVTLDRAVGVPEGYTTLTDSSGKYTLVVPVGSYMLGASKTGYLPYTSPSPLDLTYIPGFYIEDITLTPTLPPPSTYMLSITSSPVTGIPLVVDSTQTTTPYNATLPAGFHMVAARIEWTDPATNITYTFAHWEDNSINPARTINLQADMNLTSTYTPTAPPTPDFSIAASPDALNIQQGTSGTSTITIASIQGFNLPVQVTISDMPLGMTVTPNPFAITPPANSVATQDLTITVAAGTATGSYPLTVTAISGSLTHFITISVEVTSIPPAPDFSLAATPSSLTVQQGNSDTSTITATSIQGFNSPINLSVSDQPSGVTATLPTPLTPPADGSADSTLTVQVDPSTTPGTYTLTITGISGSLSRFTTITLTVTALPPTPDFSLAATPSSLTVQQGNSDTSTITATSIQGFNSPIDLSVSGQPSGVTATLATPITPPADGSVNSTLNVQVAASATAGTYALTITGLSGTLTHTTVVMLQVTSTPPQNSTVTGTVTGILWRPISGAKVTLNGKTSTTDSSGVYTMDNVPNGTYTLFVESSLYETFKTEVDIIQADTYTIDVQLGLLNVKKPVLIAGGVILGAVTIVGAVVARRKKK